MLIRRYPAPAFSYFTPLYIAYVTKQLPIYCMSLTLSKKVFNSPRTCSIASCLHVMCIIEEQNRPVQVEAKNAALTCGHPHGQTEPVVQPATKGQYDPEDGRFCSLEKGKRAAREGR